MRLDVTVALPSGPLDCAVDLPPGATVDALAAALAARLGVTAGGVWLGGRRLPGEQAVGDSALRPGVVIGLAARTPAEPHQSDQLDWPTTGRFLTVVSGAEAGDWLALPSADVELGRTSHRALDHPSVSRRHLRIRNGQQGDPEVTDLGSTNGTWVDGERLSPGVPATLPAGAVIRIGDVRMRLAAAASPDATLRAGPDRRLLLSPAPRFRGPPVAETVTWPASPPADPGRPPPVLAAAAPAVVGAATAVVLRQPVFLLVAAMSPVMTIGAWWSERRAARHRNAAARRVQASAAALARDRLQAALADEVARRRTAHPDVADTLRSAVLPTARLWERRAGDGDLLELRVATGDLDADVRVAAAAGDQPDPAAVRVADVPVVVDLATVGVLGVAGPPVVARGIVRWLAAQLACRVAPGDVHLAMVAADPDEWAWLRWLPHLQPLDGGGSGADTPLAALASLVRRRRSGATAADARPVVVMVDGLDAADHPALAAVLSDGPAVGVHTVTTAATAGGLPGACRAALVVEPGGHDRLALQRSGHHPLSGLAVEQLSVARAESVARALAGLGCAVPAAAADPLPTDVRLLPLLDLDPPHQDDIRRRWRQGPTTAVPIGVGLDGVQRADLLADGPHALVAGTTGSGKSELLQTLVAGLAAGNRPDQLNLLLLDYKGGSAFAACARLPHVVGVVTDLDDRLAARALRSLEAELTRRERVLAAEGRPSMDHPGSGSVHPVGRALARLVIVVDEFAALARELPDFVAGLVGIAQRGRSLGLHLVLATQRPGGVVSPEIRANTNLRIALRVTDRADSVDVVQTADAAGLPAAAPGRACARVGHGAVMVFQTARIAGDRPQAASDGIDVTPLRWPEPRPQAARRTGASPGGADLDQLVDAVATAAASERCADQLPPWRPPLPGVLPIGALGPAESMSPLVVRYGRADLPDRQVQPPLSFDLARAGHLLVIGGPGSGRSQTLRTFVATAAAQLSPDALHVYAVDCGDGALRALRLLPHLGALVARTEGERTDRLLRRLLAELDRRQRAIADGTATVVGQPGAVACARLAQVLVVIDRWEGFVATSAERDHGAPVEAVVRLLREGASAGLHLLITGDRSLAAGRLSGLCDEALVLRLPDPTDYALVGIDPRRVPAAVPPGRGFTGRGAVEVQVAVLSDGVDCAAGATDTDTDAFAAIAAAAPTPGPAGPFRVDALPPSVRFEAAWRLHRRRPGRLVALAGVGGDQLAALGPDLTDVPGFGIAGPPGSGRSTLLACLAVSALRQGAGILVGAPRPSPIRRLAGRPGVVDVIDAAGTVAERWWAALAAATSDRPVVVVVDDAELFRDTPAATVFAELLRRRDPATPLVVAGRADGLASLTGWPAELRQMRRGAALAVHSPVDAEVLGVRPARSLLDATGRPGRALVHLGDGVARLVTVPYDPLQDASGPAVAET